MKLMLVMAMTVDGRIARGPDHFPDWTGSEDKKRFAAITRQAGVVIMGARTFDTIGAPLPGRKNVILTRNRERRSRWDNLVFCDRPPAALLAELRREGYTTAVLAGGATINTLFAREGLIDEIELTIAPKIFGQGVSLFSSPLDLKLDLLCAEPLGSGLVCLRYAVLRPAAAAAC
jgi:dihydrofolate reductase